MSGKPTEAERKIAVQKWSNTPAMNPRYRGATPGDVVRALRRKPVCHPEKVPENPVSVKSAL
ncbi:MAG: hypothetical protein OXH66_03455 [Gemmatimonadetes bacterium]|nr:hypothetical protein [Gemmatimonadota bacterium]